MTDIPEPRPLIVDLLAELCTDYALSGARDDAFTDRRRWSTGAERAAALDRLGVELLAYRRQADEQDTELRRDPRSDAQFLADLGIVDTPHDGPA